LASSLLCCVVLWLPTAAAQFRTRVSSYGICGGQRGTGAGFFRVLWCPLPITPPISPHSSSSIIRGWYNRPNSGQHTKWTVSPYPKKLTSPKPETLRGQTDCTVALILCNPFYYFSHVISLLFPSLSLPLSSTLSYLYSLCAPRNRTVSPSVHTSHRNSVVASNIVSTKLNIICYANPELEVIGVVVPVLN
jgi:hypothetical protein